MQKAADLRGRDFAGQDVVEGQCRFGTRQGRAGRDLAEQRLEGVHQAGSRPELIRHAARKFLKRT